MKGTRAAWTERRIETETRTRSTSEIAITGLGRSMAEACLSALECQACYVVVLEEFETIELA